MLKLNDEHIFTIKTKDSENVSGIQSQSKNIVITGLNVLKDKITNDDFIFVVFGGDKPKDWVPGLVGLAHISRPPFDEGYDGSKNFKVAIDIDCYFEPSITRGDLVTYPETFDIIGIGPITKWEPNQAITSVPKEKALALIQAIYDLRPKTQKALESLFGNEFKSAVPNAVHRYVLGTSRLGQPQQILSAIPDPNNAQPSDVPSQTIYYGVPGCGKSHEVQKETKSLPKDCVMRVVFHPDYSNADFVGQILPHVVGNDVKYEFTPGPFAKILKKALRSNEPHALVIEEINRGNAAAIFGEVFQLLDRYRDEKPAGNDDWEPNIGQSRIGWSKYSIINEELEKYIVNAKDAASGAEATVVDENKVPREHMLECGLVFHVGDGIRIPPNLSIYATMNTSDQNVFTLDNAFQRRWEMKQIPNTLNNAEEGEEKKQYECEIEATGVQWGLFRDAINELITESAQESGLSSMEDKRLGGWFITPDKDGVISKDAFANKVLKYLWDDAFKFDRQKHFGNVKTLEDLIERFTEDAGFNVFQDSSIKNLKSAEPIDSGEDDGPAEPADGTSES